MIKMMKQRMSGQTKSSGKRRKQMVGKGLHTVLIKMTLRSAEVGEQEESVIGTKTPINHVPVAMKTPSIATYKIIKQGEKGVYQIVREDGTDIVYINFGVMMKSISKDDLTELYRIVMNKYGDDWTEDETRAGTDPIWSEAGHQKIISWRYYESCRVHCLNLESMDVYMLIERAYPLFAKMCKAMLDKKLQGGKPDENCYKMLKMMEKQAGVNTPGSDENRLKLYDLMYKIVNVADIEDWAGESFERIVAAKIKREPRKRWIRRIRNCEYAFSCEDLALIRRISFPGYGVLIRNVSLVLRKWSPLANVFKKDLKNVSVLVKLHDVPITAFTFARTKIDLNADVELKDTFVVVVPKIEGNGYLFHSIQVELSICENRLDDQLVRQEQNDSKNDVEEDDNETTSFMASKGYKGRGSLKMRRWNEEEEFI
ncbi:hypothetical protein Tco_0486710 [Tanacetum coccineum]